MVKNKPKPVREPLPPVDPPDLTQDTALWLTGQRSIAEQRGRRYVPESVKHPGKMQPDVAGAIIDTYTEPGQTILDPMGGIGTTAVEAAERGRHVVMIELEQRWAKIAQQNADLTARRGATGSIRVINGDARRLPELVAGPADMLVTSPPYGEALAPRSGRVDGRVERIQAAIERGELDPNRHDTWARKVVNQGHGVLGQDGLVASMDPKYVQGNWHMGDGQRAMMDPNYNPGVDAILTSPPFADSLNQSPAASDAEARRRRVEAAGHDGYKFGPNSAQAQPQRYDAVVSSPPFGPTQTGRGIALEGINGDGRPPVERGMGTAYDAVVTSPVYGESRIASAPEGKVFGQDCAAFANLPRGYDAVVTSPAYGDIRQDGGAHQFGEGSAMTNYSGEARVKKTRRDRRNVGNLKYGSMEKALALIARLKRGETIPETEWQSMEYLETMALIYWHCLHLVKPGGLAILVLKDYRRDKARVNLVGDTIRLMTQVGWIYHDQALALTSKVEEGRVVSKVSPFVRINARKPEKNGGPVLLPAGEVVLVFRKLEG
ncbi:MAG: DNA methyltransferase [Bacillota bacterium]